MSARVMIVDDDGDVRQAVTRILTKAGYQVMEASDGEAAIALLSHSADDIATIICDLQMPKVGGAEVIAHLREHHPTVPFVVLTAERDLLLTEILSKQGVCEYLLKPVSKEKLLDAVRVGVRLHELRVRQRPL
jgi:two-component system chemotaxis response regulator CheY